MKAWGVATVDMNHTPHDKSPMWKNHDEYVVFPDFAAACRWVADGSKPSDLYAITAISVVEMPALSFAIIATSPNGGNLPGDIVFKSGVNIINMTRDSGKVLDEDITIFPITVGDSITFIPEQEYHS